MQSPKSLTPESSRSQSPATQPTKNNCPCGSERIAQDCCLPLIEGKKKPQTAEELLRARYSAFVFKKIDYILNTHHSKTKKDIDRKEVEDWANQTDWAGLKIAQKEAGEASDDQGTIVFCALYREDEEEKEHWEKSFFEREAGEWKFLDAAAVHIGTYKRTDPKVGRNDPCPCGSGKKFKKCHAA